MCIRRLWGWNFFCNEISWNFFLTEAIPWNFVCTKRVLWNFLRAGVICWNFFRTYRGVSSEFYSYVLRRLLATFLTGVILWNFFHAYWGDSSELLPYRRDPWIFFHGYYGDFLERTPYWDESWLLTLTCFVLSLVYFKNVILFLCLMLALNLEVWFACFMTPKSP